MQKKTKWNVLNLDIFSQPTMLNIYAERSTKSQKRKICKKSDNAKNQAAKNRNDKHRLKIFFQRLGIFRCAHAFHTKIVCSRPGPTEAMNSFALLNSAIACK